MLRALEKKFFILEYYRMEIRGVPIGTYETPCPYISGNVFLSENVFIKEIDEEGIDYLLSIGFRHFGEHFFRPLCSECHQCIPLRIPVKDFKLSRNMKRTLKKSSDLELVVSREPEPTMEKYELYHEHLRRFEEDNSASYQSFVQSFFEPSPYSRELAIYRDGKLLSVSHFDITSRSLSAIYCYWSPEGEPYSPGTLSVLKEMEIAGDEGVEYVYLGYFVPENRHMRYKARFRPNEALVHEGLWLPLYNRHKELVHPEILEMGFTPVTTLLSESEMQ